MGLPLETTAWILWGWQNLHVRKGMNLKARCFLSGLHLTMTADSLMLMGGRALPLALPLQTCYCHHVYCFCWKFFSHNFSSVKDTFDVSTIWRPEQTVFLLAWKLPGWHRTDWKCSHNRTSINRSKILNCVEWDFTTAIRYLHMVCKTRLMENVTC